MTCASKLSKKDKSWRNATFDMDKFYGRPNDPLVAATSGGAGAHRDLRVLLPRTRSTVRRGPMKGRPLVHVRQKAGDCP